MATLKELKERREKSKRRIEELEKEALALAMEGEEQRSVPGRGMRKRRVKCSDCEGSGKDWTGRLCDECGGDGGWYEYTELE